MVTSLNSHLQDKLYNKKEGDNRDHHSQKADFFKSHIQTQGFEMDHMKSPVRNSNNSTVGQVPYQPIDYEDTKSVGFMNTSPGSKNITKYKKQQFLSSTLPDGEQTINKNYNKNENISVIDLDLHGLP